MTLADLCQRIAARLEAIPCQCDLGELDMCFRCQAIDANEELSEAIVEGDLE